MENDYNKKEQDKAAYNAQKATEDNQSSGFSCGCATIVVILVLLTLFGVEDIGENGSALIVLIAVGVGIAVAVSNSKDKKTAATNAVNIVKTEQQQRAQTMEDTFAFARECGFNLYSKVVNPRRDSCLMINTEKKQWILKTPEIPEPKLFSYDELVSYDLCCDGDTVYSSNVSSAVLGAVLAGTAGAVIGAAATRQAFNTCTSMYIKISDTNARVYRIHLLDEVVQKNSLDYKMALNTAEEFAAMLDVIKMK